MNFMFATCDRNRALQFLKALYPSKEITDTEGSAKTLLDLVEQDIVRVQDPLGSSQAQIVPAKNWDEKYRQAVVDACMIFHGS